jgi:hypothetical protein
MQRISPKYIPWEWKNFQTIGQCVGLSMNPRIPRTGVVAVPSQSNCESDITVRLEIPDHGVSLP